MKEEIDAPAEMAPTAPRIISVNIPIDKIGEVIGPKGKMINQIQEDTGRADQHRGRRHRSRRRLGRCRGGSRPQRDQRDREPAGPGGR